MTKLVLDITQYVDKDSISLIGYPEGQYMRKILNLDFIDEMEHLTNPVVISAGDFMVTRSFVRGFIEKSYDALGAYEISRRYAFKGEFFIKEIKRFEIEWYITEKNIQLLHKESLDKSKFRGILKKFNPFK